MGFGIGIGMGWPMASSSSSANLGYFAITEICGRIDPRPIMATSQLINTNLYNQGDYVDASDNRGNTFRVCLGEIVLEPSRNPLTISGPAYVSCPVYFKLINSCKGAIMDDWTSQLLVDASIYNEGDYVDGTPPIGGSDRYILGVTQQTPGSQIAELYGPAYTKC